MVEVCGVHPHSVTNYVRAARYTYVRKTAALVTQQYVRLLAVVNEVQVLVPIQVVIEG